MRGCCSRGLLVVASALLACHRAPTEVVVTLRSDAPGDRALTLVAHARDESGETAGPAWVSGDREAIHLPASFAVTPRAGSPRDGRMTVVVEASLAASATDPVRRFRRTARFSFTPYTPTQLTLALAIACADHTDGCTTVQGPDCTVSILCDERGQTCGEQGRCQSPDEQPTPIEPGPDGGGGADLGAPDAGPDAALDAGPDAGPDAAPDVAADVVAPPDAPPRLPPTAHLAASDAHTCAIVANRVYCWGRDTVGEVGTGTAGGVHPSPVLVAGLPAGTPTHVCTGPVVPFSCVVIDGAAYCWGDNRYGQLGNGTNVSSTAPTRVMGLAGITHVSCGTEFACAAGGGQAYCWGHGYLGKLGTGGTGSSFAPVPVTFPAGQRPTMVWAGYDHACAIDEAQAAWCWGRNENDRALGLGPMPPPAPAPLAVAGGHRFANVQIATWGACGLTAEGGALCWGDAAGNDTFSDVPVAPAGFASGVRAAARGGGTSIADASCVVSSAGALSCWGSNQYGRLGTGDTGSRGTPTPVVGLAEPVGEVAIGFDYTCALTTSGAVFCWGLGADGQLGDGTMGNRLTPAFVTFPP